MMNLEKQKRKAEQKIMFYPPCGIMYNVVFKDEKCPISSCKSCNDCVTNDHDLSCIVLLRDTAHNEFGHT